MIIFKHNPILTNRTSLRMYSSSSIIDEFFKKLDDECWAVSSVGDEKNISKYQDKVLKLLHEKKTPMGPH